MHVKTVKYELSDFSDFTYELNALICAFKNIMLIIKILIFSLFSTITNKSTIMEKKGNSFIF